MIRRRSLAAALAWLLPMPRPKAAPASGLATAPPRSFWDEVVVIGAGGGGAAAGVSPVAIETDALLAMLDEHRAALVRRRRAWDAEVDLLRRDRDEGHEAASAGLAP